LAIEYVSLGETYTNLIIVSKPILAVFLSMAVIISCSPFVASQRKENFSFYHLNHLIPMIRQ